MSALTSSTITPYFTSHDGRITIYHGDCREVLPTLTEAVDLVLTDPPYLTGNAQVPIRARGVVNRVHDSASIGLPWGYDDDWVDLAARLTPSHWVVYCGFMMLGSLLPAIERHAKIGNLFTWQKVNAPLMTRNVPRMDCEFVAWLKDPKSTNIRAGEFKSSVLNVPMPQAGCFATERFLQPGSGQAAHPTQKPIAIVTPFVSRLSEVGNLIIDPFMGTGTSIVAAHHLGRRAIGIEIEERYCEIAAKRLAQAVLPLEMAAG